MVGRSISDNAVELPLDQEIRSVDLITRGFEQQDRLRTEIDARVCALWVNGQICIPLDTGGPREVEAADAGQPGLAEGRRSKARLNRLRDQADCDRQCGPTAGKGRHAGRRGAACVRRAETAAIAHEEGRERVVIALDPKTPPPVSRRLLSPSRPMNTSAELDHRHIVVARRVVLHIDDAAIRNLRAPMGAEVPSRPQKAWIACTCREVTDRVRGRQARPLPVHAEQSVRAIRTSDDEKEFIGLCRAGDFQHSGPVTANPDLTCPTLGNERRALPIHRHGSLAAWLAAKYHAEIDIGGAAGDRNVGPGIDRDAAGPGIARSQPR